MKNSIVSAFFLLICFTSCTEKKMELPVERPQDLSVNYLVDGGMSDYSVQIDIASDSCHYRKRNEGKVSEKHFKLHSADLDSIYTLLQKNKFDRINYKTVDETIHDRGGISMTAGWEKNRITVSNAQNNFVSDEWYEQWKMLTEGIEGMMTRKAEADQK